MPVTDGIGHGEITPRKYEYLRKIFEMHLNVTRNVIEGGRAPVNTKTYRYIDLTAGSGIVPDTREPGSPLVFLDAIESQPGNKLGYRLDLVEKKKANFDALQRNVEAARMAYPAGNNQVFYHRGSYETVVPSLFRQDWVYEYGLAFVDPSGTAPDLAALAEISIRRPRLEILIYVSASNLKRGGSSTGIQLDQYTTGIRKSHWLVRSPDADDKHQWTFLLGTNGASVFKSYPGIHLYDVNSKAGKAAWEKLNWTRKQRAELYQMPLLSDDDPTRG